MIEKISIQNFKSLVDIDLECKNLNLLTGMNGMGKSSVIQTLLLLRQSNDRGFLQQRGLTLNGDLVEIGTGKDAFSQFSKTEETVKFKLSFKDIGDCQWAFSYSDNDEINEGKRNDSDMLPYAAPQDSNKIDYFNYPLFTSAFDYLNTERWVRNQYDRSDYQVRERRSLGKHGQYAAHFLEYYGTSENEKVHETLLYPGTTVSTLAHQVSAWMNEISTGSSLKVEKIPGVNSIKLRYQFATEEGGTDDILPTNVGFGMTYVFPVLVALLSAKSGRILVIENPESHLHPQGQSAIGRLMAKVAKLGVQLFVETHSDHILNGICVAISKKEFDHLGTKFFHFHKNNGEQFTTKYEVPVLEDGKVDDRNLKKIRVTGFFDQINKDLEKIVFKS